MTDASTKPLQVIGDPAAESCEGEFCVIPEHHTQAIVNRKIDLGEI